MAQRHVGHSFGLILPVRGRYPIHIRRRLRSAGWSPRGPHFLPRYGQLIKAADLVWRAAPVAPLANGQCVKGSPPRELATVTGTNDQPKCGSGSEIVVLLVAAGGAGEEVGGTHGVTEQGKTALFRHVQLSGQSRSSRALGDAEPAAGKRDGFAGRCAAGRAQCGRCGRACIVIQPICDST